MNRIWRQRDERGAILILATVGVVLAVICAALAVDLGRIAQEKRNDQKVADLAALDAARDLTNHLDLAQKSAIRNGFDYTLPGHSLQTELGSISPAGAFLPGVGSTAVRVTVASPLDNSFRPGSQTLTAKAVASALPLGGFMIGSSLVTLDASRSMLLNKFLGGMLKGSDLSLSVASWQGLVGANITLEALRQELVTMGVSAGNVGSMLASNITVAQLYQAAANALTAKGDVANATILNNLRLAVTNTTQFTLGDLMSVSQGADNAALGSTINIFQLVTGGAEVANGSNFIDIGNVNITVPGVASTRVKLKVTEPPQFWFGPVGTGTSTSQIELVVTPTLNLGLSVLGLTSATVTNTMEVHLTGAGASGTIKAITCGAAGGMTITVDPTAFSAPATTSGLHIDLTLLNLLGVPVGATVDVPATTSISPAIDGPAVDLTWNYPSEFPPPLGTTTTKHAGSQPIGLQSLTNITLGTPVYGGVGAPLLNATLKATLMSTLLSGLGPVLGDVDGNVLTPLLTALGIDVGSADVTALQAICGTPALVG